MNICQWESCVESGYHVCSQSIKNNNTLTIQNIICNCFNSIKRSFCINMWPWMNHGSTTTLRSQISSQLSGQQQLKAIQSDQRCKHQQAKFWVVQGILFINYLEKVRTINSEYYIALLVSLKEEINKKQPQMKKKKKKVLVHHDNALCHKSITMMAKLHELHFKLLLHPLYSPDLTLCNYWLFAELQRMLQEKRFVSNEEVITEAYFEAIEKSFYKKVTELLDKHWNQCITLEGDYVDV